ncbi:hypothetical protein ACSBR2_024208 [Camellia fascicularis]
MESSHNLGDAEECQSSESGWTMYIGSPIDNSDDGDDNDSDVGDDNNNDDYVNRIVKHEDESDDSMASDASSGPSHRENSWGSGKGSSGKHCSNKKDKHTVEKMNGNETRKLKKEKEEVVFASKGAKIASRSSEKVRKTSTWFGKRK